LPRRKNESETNTLPDPEQNPLLNPLLAAHMGRWAEVYFTNPPEKRPEAIAELIRELESAVPTAEPAVPALAREIAEETGQRNGGRRRARSRRRSAAGRAAAGNPADLRCMRLRQCSGAIFLRNVRRIPAAARDPRAGSCRGDIERGRERERSARFPGRAFA